MTVDEFTDYYFQNKYNSRFVVDEWMKIKGEILLARNAQRIKDVQGAAKERLDNLTGGIENLLKLINEIKEGNTQRF